MTPEEEFNSAIWWTLQEIKLALLFSEMKNLVDEKKSDVIDFEIKDKYNAPSMDNQRRAIEFLEKREAVAIMNRKYPMKMPQIGAELYNLKPIEYALSVLQPKFEELYKSYGDNAEIRRRAILETFFDETEQENEPLPQTKEPLHIVIDEVKKDIGIKGFEERVILQKPKNKKIQLRKFPAGLKWEEISIQFLNKHEVIVKAKNETLQTTYEAMGFQDEKKKLPNKQWQFLQLLALKNGEVSWENNQGLPLKQINSIKKQKQLLTEALKAYFQTYDSEPFHDYKTEKAYRIKITLTPEPELKDIDEREVYDE